MSKKYSLGPDQIATSIRLDRKEWNAYRDRCADLGIYVTNFITNFVNAWTEGRLDDNPVIKECEQAAAVTQSHGRIYGRGWTRERLEKLKEKEKEREKERDEDEEPRSESEEVDS